MTTSYRTMQALFEANNPLSNGQIRAAIGTPLSGQAFRQRTLQTLLSDSNIVEVGSEFTLTPQGAALYRQIKRDRDETTLIAKPTKLVNNGVPLWATPARSGAMDFTRIPSRGYPT